MVRNFFATLRRFGTGRTARAAKVGLGEHFDEPFPAVHGTIVARRRFWLAVPLAFVLDGGVRHVSISSFWA
jgi:hypothetical protein